MSWQNDLKQANQEYMKKHKTSYIGFYHFFRVILIKFEQAHKNTFII